MAVATDEEQNEPDEAPQPAGSSFLVGIAAKTEELTWQQAIGKVISDQQRLFLAQTKLLVKGEMSGRPDLIYIRHQETHISLEVWDITFGTSVSYAKKWRVAFYTYLLDCLLKDEIFLLPVKISPLGGLIHPPMHRKEGDVLQPEVKTHLFKKSPFISVTPIDKRLDSFSIKAFLAPALTKIWPVIFVA